MTMHEVKRQVALFGVFSSIDGRPESLSKLLELQRSLNLKYEVISQQIGPMTIHSPLLINNERRLKITIGLTRLDIEEEVDDNMVELQENFSNFISVSKQIVRYFDANFDFRYNRLALNGNFIVEDPNYELYDLYVKGIKSFVEDKREWSVQEVKHGELQVIKEQINAIYTLKGLMGTGEPADIPKVNISYDFNTFPKLTEFRFQSENVINFIDEVVPFRMLILNDVLKND